MANAKDYPHLLCPQCKSPNKHSKGATKAGTDAWKCKDCGKDYTTKTAVRAGDGVTDKVKPVNGAGLHGGISIDEFLQDNDVATRVDKVLRALPKNKLFTIDEIQEATGFRRGFPQLRTTIDAHREYYGKGVADGKLHFGHPEVIAELKRQKAMS